MAYGYEVQVLVVVAEHYLGSHPHFLVIHGQHGGKAISGLCLEPCCFIHNAVYGNGAYGTVDIQPVFGVDFLCKNGKG
jgi:hypothetical protein